MAREPRRPPRRSPHAARERARAGLTQSELGNHPDVIVSGQLIGHIENCRRSPTRRLSLALDRAFDLDGFFEDLFEDLYDHVVDESGVPATFWEYSDQETLASSVKVYNNFLISGLLKTGEYATHVLRAGQQPDKFNELFEARMARQQILNRGDPPFVFVILDELVLRRIVGGAEIMRHQFEHLLTPAERPNITIVLAPRDAPVYPGTTFTLLGFPDRPGLAYVEGVGGHGGIIDSGPQVAALDVLFDRVASMALPVADSEKLIRAILEGMCHPPTSPRRSGTRALAAARKARPA